MKKKKLFISIFVGVLALILIAYVFILPQKSSSTVLSDRAREFMQKQKSANSQVWRNVVTTSTPKKLNQEVRIENCYSFRVPFVIDHTTIDSGCSVMVSLEGGGQIAASKRAADYEDVADAPDVAFRKRNEEYRQVEVVSEGGGKYLTFVRSVEGFEQTAFFISNGQYITISLSKATNENLSKEFKDILSSLELL